MAEYDRTREYEISFKGGPLDGQKVSSVPADRLAFEEKAPNGKLLKTHLYNLREIVARETGDLLGLEYHYS